MFLSKVKILAAVGLLMAATCFGASLRVSLKAEEPSKENEERSLRATAEVSTEREGRIVLIGTELKEGVKIPEKDRVTVAVGFLAVHTGDQAYVPYKEGDPFLPGKLFVAQEKRNYRKLHVGATVEAGQLIALVDSTPQLNEVALKIAKLEAAESEWQASIKTREEAIRRSQAHELPMTNGRRDISEDTIPADLLSRDRSIEEAKGKDAARKVASEDLRVALAALKMYEIRASEKGTIREILKRPGETIRAFEPVVRLEVENDSPDVRQVLPAVFNVPAQREGVLLVVGTEVKKGAKIPADLLVTVKGDGKTYRRLRVGDAVEEGDLLAKVDDRLERLDLDVQKTKLDAAKADLRAASGGVNAAQQALDRLDKLVASKAVDVATVEAAKSARELAADAVVVKEAAVRQAQLDVQKAEITLEMYEIRSPVRGVIKAILKNRGEAVKSLETVVQIQEMR